MKSLLSKISILLSFCILSFSAEAQFINKIKNAAERGVQNAIADKAEEAAYKLAQRQLEKQLADGSARQMIGLVMDDKGVLRHGQAVFSAAGDGEILSGTFSPTLSKGIALARVPAGAVGAVEVDIRGRRHPLRMVKYPFVRDGKPQPGV
jgi:glycine cleavage system aminomethyltransferase T